MLCSMFSPDPGCALCIARCLTILSLIQEPSQTDTHPMNTPAGGNRQTRNSRGERTTPVGDIIARSRERMACARNNTTGPVDIVTNGGRTRNDTEVESVGVTAKEFAEQLPLHSSQRNGEL